MGNISSLSALTRPLEPNLHRVQVTDDISSLSVLTNLQGLIFR